MRDTVVDYPPPAEPTRVVPVIDPRRHGRRARRRGIRIRVATLAVALFIGAWAVIGVQMASGHDPALAATNKRSTLAVDQTAATAAKTAAAKRSSAAATTSSTTTGSSSGSSSSASASTASSSSGTTSVSTHQS
jgi:hypothetical protein